MGASFPFNHNEVWMKKSLSSLLPLLASVLSIMMGACASLSLNNVDFAWPVESSLQVNNSNSVEDGRYAVAFNVAPLATEEFQDSSALKGKSLRILRNSTGYYFVTATGFRNVYVFSPGEGKLSMKEKISIGKNTEGQELKLENPALNQRPPYVELLDGQAKYLLSPDGMLESAGGPKE